MLDSNLIFDIGAHKGEDTEFYLRKGFRVLAVEANPQFCELIRINNEEFLSSGALTILNVAISDKSEPLTFYINEDVSVWGSANLELVERNRGLGAGNIKTIVVNACRLAELIYRYGTPRYCKIDIEGNDILALQSLTESRAPKFISIESDKTDFNRLLDEFRLLENLGYRKYKIIDQSMVEFHREPFPPREGSFLDYRFKQDSSGLFGDELPGEWTTVIEAIEIYKNIFRGYAINGDHGLFVGGRKSLFNMLGELQKKVFQLKGFKYYQNPASLLPQPGWYDTHATKA
jgi:FkbM family methyltransferase